MVVPKHGAAQQSDEQRDDQHRQQGDEPAQHRYTCGTGQISNVAPTWEMWRWMVNEDQMQLIQLFYNKTTLTVCIRLSCSLKEKAKKKWHNMVTYPHCQALRLSWPNRGRWLWLPCSWGWCQHELGMPPQLLLTGQKIPCCHDDTLRNRPTSLTLPGTSVPPGCCRLERGSELRDQESQSWNVTE